MPADKKEDLKRDRETDGCHVLTNNQGVAVSDDHNSLKAGDRGPTLLEDFMLREKITHFDHERIPERVVHARGTGAHGHFQVYASLAKYTRAKFLTDPSAMTPVFVRFSTVVGSRGSADTVRDVRGFAVKFYTPEGVFDLVGNNIPIFFIQDAIKFPDLIHAAKPEPNLEMPQAQTAHDNFWDFASLTPESAHMLLWVMSDRAIPRSYRMMEGFGVNTYRLVDAKGASRFVKFHWKPKLGVHSLVWDEAQKIAGKDPDYHRRDLYRAILTGQLPEWELAIQTIPEADEMKFPFDVLDPTKIWPEQLVPLEVVGKLTLDTTPENFFGETEQVAFCVSHMVPGVDLSDDPLLQGRLFSYLDTQISRLGGPNFAEIPINRPLNEVHNNQRDGLQRHRINPSRTPFSPNSLSKGCPFHAGNAGFVTVPERIDAHKVRARSASFRDHFGQAALFWRSMSSPEKQHIVDAFSFELGKVDARPVRQRVVDLLTQVDVTLAGAVAGRIGAAMTTPEAALARLKADWNKFGVTSPPGKSHDYAAVKAPELSMASTVKDTVETRMVAVLVADGVDGPQLDAMKASLAGKGAKVVVIAPNLAPVQRSDGNALTPDQSLLTAASVLFDAVYVPGGPPSVAALRKDGRAIHFLNEAYRHYKSLAATDEGLDLLLASDILPPGPHNDADLAALPGVVVSRKPADVAKVADIFGIAIARHRHFDRKNVERVPA